MDEAERCHRLAYLAYGRLLTQGTAEEVIARLAPRDLDGHRRAARRGWPAALRAPAGRRAGGARSATRCTSAAPIAALLERSTAAWRADPGLRWQRGRAPLEDVFILNMRRRRSRSHDVAAPGLASRRFVAILVKEFLQMRRDRLTFAMMVGIPILQLMLFGYAINTDPKHLPTAVRIADQSAFARSLVRGAAEHRLFPDRARRPRARPRPTGCSRPARCSSCVTIPPDFCRDLMRGERPAAAGRGRCHRPGRRPATRCRALMAISRSALDHDLTGPARRARRQRAAVRAARPPPLQPGRASPRYNIVPGLIGVILTMTMVMMTALASDPRARARHDGKPARHAGAAARGDAAARSCPTS